MSYNDKELITWTNKLSCGIKLIDDQHKGLVDLVNDMFEHATGNCVDEQDYFSRVIREVVNYVKTHFAAEERILLATNFSGYTAHKREHDNFILAIVENIRDYEAGKRLTLFTFTRFLRDWILSHIALMDKQYFEYLKKIAAAKKNSNLPVS